MLGPVQSDCKEHQLMPINQIPSETLSLTPNNYDKCDTDQDLIALTAPVVARGIPFNPCSESLWTRLDLTTSQKPSLLSKTSHHTTIHPRPMLRRGMHKLMDETGNSMYPPTGKTRPSPCTPWATRFCAPSVETSFQRSKECPVFRTLSSANNLRTLILVTIYPLFPP